MFFAQTFAPTLYAGSFPVLSLMIGAVVTRLVPEENFTDVTEMNQQRVMVASSMTFLVGIFQVVFFVPVRSV